MNEVNFIKNAGRVIRHFHKWPVFHDAEILYIELDRESISVRIKLYAFDTLKELDEQGYYKQTKQCLVTLSLRKIQEIELYDFNEQNVLFNLTFEKKANEIVVTLTPSYGIRGRIVCQEVEVLGVEPLSQEPERKRGLRGPARALRPEELKLIGKAGKRNPQIRGHKT